MSYVDPNNCSNINDLHKLIDKSNSFVFQLQKIDSEFSVNEFIVEMKDFSQKWDSIKTLANYEIKDFSQEDEWENIEQQDEENDKQKKEDFKCKTTCKNCIVCCFDVLRQYNLHTSAYKNVFLAYTYILTFVLK